jgi:50S ribosome-binding GTPase
VNTHRDGYGGQLDERAWDLLNDALDVYRDDAGTSRWLHQYLRRFDEPLRIGVVGPPQSGKSTLINAIIGADVAPIELDGADRPFVWYQDGARPRAALHSPRGSVTDLPVTRHGRLPHIDTPPAAPDGVDEVSVEWPSRALRHAILVDTPAVRPAPDPAAAPSTMDRVSREADALLYLTRHTPGTELGTLRDAADTTVSRLTPVHTIVVLSRADEVGGGRIDGLQAAKQTARRYRRDARGRAVCQNVIAVAGLIAAAGRAMHETQYAHLAALAAVDRAELDEALLSTDRFLGTTTGQLSSAVRRDLLDRLGLVGIRLATVLIRQGCPNHRELASQLVRRSGLAELRESISQLFVQHRGVLQARSALLALERLTQAKPCPGADRLVAELERTVVGAHEFRELRLLAALRSGRTRLPDDLETDALRLIGADGARLPSRLGTDESATNAQLYALADQALRRWREHTEDPRFGQVQRGAAQVVARSCEGMLRTLDG